MEELTRPTVSDKLYSNPRTLNVITTSKCNLDCSFCGGAYYMHREDTTTEVQKESIIEALENNPTITNIQWSGGEPLLATRKIDTLIEEIREKYPRCEHYLYTNGLKMRKSHLPLLKGFDSIFFSMDGFKESERPFMRIIEEKQYEVLETIYELKNIRTWAVLTRERIGDKRWYEDIIALHNHIYHYGFCEMSLVLDKNMPKPLSPDHVMNFIYGYFRIQENIERLNVLNSRDCGFIVNRFFDQACNVCSESLRIDADGEENQLKNVPITTKAGCNQLASSIGVEAYEYIRRVVMAERNRGAENESRK